MSNRISFDRMVEIWKGIYEDALCPDCLIPMVIYPHYGGDEPAHPFHYLLYICDKCKQEYHISCEYLKLLKELAGNVATNSDFVIRERDKDFNVEDDK